MRVAIIGTGYVGLPTGVGLAELGNQVICIDCDRDKIARLQQGEMTLYEDGLDALFARNLQNGNLRFTASMQEGVANAELVIIAVGTPPHPETGEADMSFIHAAANELAAHLSGYTVIATKSTVPVGTGDVIESLIAEANPAADFDVVSLPEFLREGFAVHDFFNPDRIVVGANSDRAKDVIATLYKPFEGKTKMLYVSRRSSETIKYASNAFLAIKIHYINEMADFCEKAGADIAEVADGMGMDTRIGNRFLNAGPGYGGSCFPKDTCAMAHMGRENNVNLSLVEAAINGNDRRKKDMAGKILAAVGAHDTGPRIAVLGLAFKGGTDDCRASPAIEIVEELLAQGATVTAYDPKAMENARRHYLGDRIAYADSAYAAAQDADVLAILTEWDEFRTLDLLRIRQSMKQPRLVDLRNLLQQEQVQDAGLDYCCIGRTNAPAKGARA